MHPGHGPGCRCPKPKPPEPATTTHIAGIDTQAGGRVRQLCAWCGHRLVDLDLDRIAVPEGQDPRPATWPIGALVRVEQLTPPTDPRLRPTAATRVEPVLVDGVPQLPADACPLRDPATT